MNENRLQRYTKRILIRVLVLHRGTSDSIRYLLIILEIDLITIIIISGDRNLEIHVVM